MAEWLTGSAVREMNDQIRLGLPPLGQPDNGFYQWSTTNLRQLLDENKRLLRLLPQLLELAESRADEYGTSGMWDEITDARACLAAQDQ